MTKFNAVINNVEVRGHEVKQNKQGEDYVLVRVEDETGTSIELIDKDLDRTKYYKRGTLMDITVNVVASKFTTIRIVDAKEIK